MPPTNGILKRYPKHLVVSDDKRTLILRHGVSDSRTVEHAEARAGQFKRNIARHLGLTNVSLQGVSYVRLLEKAGEPSLELLAA